VSQEQENSSAHKYKTCHPFLPIMSFLTCMKNPFIRLRKTK